MIEDSKVIEVRIGIRKLELGPKQPYTKTVGGTS